MELMEKYRYTQHRLTEKHGKPCSTCDRGNEILVQDGVRGPLFLGDIECMKSADIVTHYGFKNIISVTEKGEQVKSCPVAGVTHQVFNLPDRAVKDGNRRLQQLCMHIDRAVAQGSTLVHCFSGNTKSAAAVIAYLISKLEYPYKQAFGWVTGCRRTVQLSIGMTEQLRAFEIFSRSLGHGEGEGFWAGHRSEEAVNPFGEEKLPFYQQRRTIVEKDLTTKAKAQRE
jgi:protein-tyrosine phosphatase